MVDSPKTSFIPKQAIGSVPGRVPHRRRHFNILGFIGMVIFLCGMILAVGVYLYKDVSEKALVSKKQELKDIKSSFSQSDIEALRELDRRINVANVLLNEHLSPSVVFDALELRTQRDVTFTDFSYDRRESGSVELVLEGTALRFNTVALQSTQLADAEVLARTIFSGLNVDDDGHVQFTSTSEGNKAALAYTVLPVGIPLEDQSVGTTTATTSDDSTINSGTTIPETP
jgi:hypothetical protein